MKLYNTKRMYGLSSKKCVPCEGGTPSLGPLELAHYLSEAPGWLLEKNKKAIAREFSFPDFKEAMRFMNGVAKLAEKENHHPDMFLHNWNQVRVMLSTHAIDGMSENDFILAAKINEIK